MYIQHWKVTVDRWQILLINNNNNDDDDNDIIIKICECAWINDNAERDDDDDDDKSWWNLSKVVSSWKGKKIRWKLMIPFVLLLDIKMI